MDTNVNTLRDGRNASQAAQSKDGQLQMEIGFIGLGHMGKPMAANLAAAGHKVSAFVRHADSSAMAAIDAILARTIPDPVEPEFMAPPDQLAT